jgi:hypothetical protein
MDLSAAQLQSGTVQCQHTGSHTLWEVAAMAQRRRPAFGEEAVALLLAVDLLPNVRRMEQIRTLGNTVQARAVPCTAMKKLRIVRLGFGTS